MNPEELLYAETHEWVSLDDGVATVGISAFAVEQLNDLVYMDLPAVGTKLTAGEEFGEVESVKAVSPLYSPVDGEVIAVNEALPENLDWLSEDPYRLGWIMKAQVDNEDALRSLLDYAAYQRQCSESA